MARLSTLSFLFWLLSVSLLTNVHAQVQGGLAHEQLELAEKGHCSKQKGLTPLKEILCNGEIKIGVKGDYRQFGELQDGVFTGYEVDLARKLAERLGVQVKFVQVSGADRIRRLLTGEIDMILATMGHTSDRDEIIHFVRPQYYAAPTTIVGAKDKIVRSWEDLAGSVICVPAANFSNIEFAKRKGQRIMIYSDPTRLTQALLLGACSLIAHDQTFIRAYLTGLMAPPERLLRFDEKVSFFEIPWGIGVTKQAEASLGRWLDLTLADMHQSGLLIKLASAHGVSNEFLVKQQKLWTQEPCRSSITFDKECLVPGGDTFDPPSAISAGFEALDKLFLQYSIKPIKFPMFTGQNAFQWFLQGLQVTLLLVVGSLVATLALGVGLFKLQQAKWSLIRLTTNLLLVFLQNSPVILLLILGYLGVSLFLAYTIPISIISAVIVIGLNNGANVAGAMREVWLTAGQQLSVGATMQQATVPIRAALINAAKATPVAGFIGVSDLLATLNDITAFTGEQLTTFLVLTVIYLCLIEMVVIGVTKTSNLFSAKSVKS